MPLLRKKEIVEFLQRRYAQSVRKDAEALAEVLLDHRRFSNENALALHLEEMFGFDNPFAELLS